METLIHTNEAVDTLTNYPRSYASTESHVNRSRAWSEDITKHWNVPITGLETFSERAQRYLVYFQLTTAQLKHIYEKFQSELTTGLEMHSTKSSSVETVKCSLKMSDTFIDTNLIPSGKEKGYCVALDFGGIDLDTAVAAKVQLNGFGKLTCTKVEQLLRTPTETMPKGCLDSNASASMLFDSLAALVKKLSETKAAALPSKKFDICVSIAFPLKQRSITQAFLLYWTKGYETGRKTNDTVEGMDVDAFLERAFWRAKVDAKIVALTSDASAILLAGAYEKPTDLPPCCVGFSIGCGVNGCYIQPDAKTKYGYSGSIINCELGNFDKSLPVNDVDLEVDFGDEATEGTQIFEKMVAPVYLGELCRRFIVKIWQSEAPGLAWVRHSLPWIACMRIIESSDEDSFDLTDTILQELWDWETTAEERRAVKQLFKAVFERSAMLLAVAIIALSSQTGRLQRAMGGLTCVISGSLYEMCPYYQKCLRATIKSILPEDISDCISILSIEDGILKGTGVLGTLVSR